MGRVRAEAFDEVVQRFYEAASMPELWPAALHCLAMACDAGGAVIIPVVGLKPIACIPSEGIAEAIHDGLSSGWLTPELSSRMRRGMALFARGWRGLVTETMRSAPMSWSATRSSMSSSPRMATDRLAGP